MASSSKRCQAGPLRHHSFAGLRRSCGYSERFELTATVPGQEPGSTLRPESIAQVLKYFVNPDSVPFERPPHFALGSKDKAECVGDELGPAYSTTAGATARLRSQVRKLL
jgi:hypothetical protein